MASISATTRLPRPGEKNDQDYYFLDQDEFKRKIQTHEFLEWAIVHGKYYGTSRNFIETTLKKGVCPLLAIDVQGALAIKKKMPDVILIFLAPPSMESLKIRLEKRQDTEDSVQKRLADSKFELSAAKSYDYIVVNDDLEKAVSQIDAIITAERSRVFRQEMKELLPV
jgi:guanylate kinase